MCRFEPIPYRFDLTRLYLKVRRIFREVDIDESGTIEKEELLEVCDDKNGKLFDKLDVDGDHHIDVEEFIKYINVMAMTRGQKAAKALIKHLLSCKFLLHS